MTRPDKIRRLLAASREPYTLLYEVAVGTGLRRGELLGLKWGDLDLRKGLLYVRRSRGAVKDGDHNITREAPVKTRHSRRVVDLSPVLIERLKALRQEHFQRTKVIALHATDEPDYVFCSRAGKLYHPNHMVQRAFKRHLKAAGLPEIRFHDLRHTHASLLVHAGVHPKAIQARMGHANIQTTLNTYGHLMPQAFAGVGERLDAPLYGTNKAPDVGAVAANP